MKRQIKIGEIAEINANSLTQKDMFQEIMYLDTGNITRNEIDNIQILNITMDKIPSRAKRKVKDKTIIYSTVRPNQEHYGFLENPSDNFIVSTGFSTIDVYDDNTDEKFIYYLLTQKHITDYLHTIGENSVSSYPSINPDDIANLKFTVPDLKTQQSIAAVLSALDKKIALNKQINARLEEMAKTLYDYWFVQFDFPDANGKPYKSSGGEMVFDETLKREIPKGWEVKSLGNLAEIVGGSTPSTADSDNFCSNGTAWITPYDLSKNQDNKFISHGEIDVSEKGIKNASLKKYPTGTVLMSSRAPIGYMAIARNEVTTNQGFKSFIPNKGFSKEFVFYAVKNSLKSIMQSASGSTFKEVSATTLHSIQAVFPKHELVEKYTERSKKIFKIQDNLEKQNHQLTQLRDFLLPMLMNGQVSVAE
ncbi:type I restriction modification DNA specificity domain protein [Neisseria meningitidis 93004]|uniref:restriction endonuclease subunit S n=1 Tax=Neisseria meningitidis TaxID=487 RepID=UPI00027C9A64|nr:restriction endonuclease subunit S [Neisseria meningitidis]EJU54624.1 type I restriction modification DNA specificity domain protein [Neisseria meningitidis 93004]